MSRILAIIIIIIGFPFFVLVLIVHCIFIGSSPFFSQVRIGKNEKRFIIYKLRSLPINEHSKSGNYVADNQSLTPWMRFLRKSHLDEFPQLINLIKGDIVFIGPRPLLPQYLLNYSDFQKKRHLVDQGIFGLAQAYGGNGLNWTHRLRFDTFYATHKSIKLDIYILLVHLKIKKPRIFNKGISMSHSNLLDS